MQGEPLDAQRLLFTPEGKPRISIISIAHLNDAERMFIVTLVLNEVIAWMRNQSGTGSLRAILYMDEIFGFFPPTANPPSKQPMLTLLKQARAFGLGVVLATQNPVDLDYKGLANCGTWFIGRLQTERDKLRVIEGLKSALAGAGDGADLEALMSSLTQRVFLMRNVHDDAPVLMKTRWALSYLRGPLTGPGDRACDGCTQEREHVRASASYPAGISRRRSVAASRPAVGSGIPEYFPDPDERRRDRCSTSPWSPAFRSCISSMPSSRSMNGRPPDGWRPSTTVPVKLPGKMPARMPASRRVWSPHRPMEREYAELPGAGTARRQLRRLVEEAAVASVRNGARQSAVVRRIQGGLEGRRNRGRLPLAPRARGTREARRRGGRAAQTLAGETAAAPGPDPARR